jgi:hypothetical protein
LANSNRKLINLVGQTFGRLTVTQEVSSLFHARRAASGNIVQQKTRRWECICICGTVSIVRQGNLLRKHTTSCGCLVRERLKEASQTHRMSRTPEYRAWGAMFTRCYNQKIPKYKDYGGRGITVCDRWHKFENFWADMGNRPSPKHSLDRIDVNGNYEPQNCRWTTMIVQVNNKRTNHWITLGNLTLTIAQWARKLQLHPSTIYRRLHHTDDPVQILRPSCRPTTLATV